MPAKIDFDVTLALAPSLQTGLSAASASFARHVLSATTATAAGNFTTFFTPRIAFAGASSSEASVPPNTGDAAMAA